MDEIRAAVSALAELSKECARSLGLARGEDYHRVVSAVAAMEAAAVGAGLPENVRELVRYALSDPDDECCVRCHALGSTDDGCDPSPMCHHCAQEAVLELAQYLAGKATST